MNETTVKPALTPDQWRYRFKTTVSYDRSWTVSFSAGQVFVSAADLGDGTGACLGLHPEILHAVAALCLDGIPEGFTQEDLDALRNAVVGTPTMADEVRAVDAINRIEALVRCASSETVCMTSGGP